MVVHIVEAVSEHTSNDGEPGAIDSIKPGITVIDIEGFKKHTSHNGILRYGVGGRGINKSRRTVVEVENLDVDINFV